mgnify:CR=1 FL=1
MTSPGGLDGDEPRDTEATPEDGVGGGDGGRGGADPGDAPDSLDHVKGGPELDGVDDTGDQDLGAGRSSIRRNVAHMLSSQVATWSLALILAVVQPRLLGPETQGQIRLAFSLWTIAAVVVSLGTTLYLNLQVARRGRAALTLVGPIITLRMIAWALMSVVFAVGAVVGGADEEFAWILVLYGLTFAVQAVADVFNTVFFGLERMAAPAVVNVVVRFVGTIAAVIVLLLGGRAISLLVVLFAAQLVGLFLIARALRRVVEVPLHFGRSSWSAILAGGFAFMIANGIRVLYQQIDTVVIALFVDDEALGWYATADVLFGTLLFLPMILCGTILPTMGRMHATDPDGLQRLVTSTFGTLGLMMVPIGFGTFVVADQAARLLYGAAFDGTGPVLAVFGLVLVLTAGTMLFGSMAMATERQRFWNMVMFAGVVLTVPLDLVLVPWADRTYDNGAIGGALAFVVTELLMFGFGLWRVAPFLLERRTMWRLARILLAGAVLVLASWPTRGGSLIVTLAVGAVSYVVAIAVLRVLGPEELGMLRRLRSRVLPGRFS